MLIKKKNMFFLPMFLACLSVLTYTSSEQYEVEVSREILSSECLVHEHGPTNECTITVREVCITYDIMEQEYSMEPKSRILEYIADGLYVFSLGVGVCGGTVTIPFTGGAGYTITVPASVCVGTALAGYILTKVQENGEWGRVPIGGPHKVGHGSRVVTEMSHSADDGR